MKGCSSAALLLILSGMLSSASEWREPAAKDAMKEIPSWLVSRHTGRDGRVTFRGVVMGTVFTVRAYPGKGMSREAVGEACLKALECARAWEKVMSDRDVQSELSILNAAPDGVRVKISPELRQVLALSLEYARLSRGAFDPSLGSCIRLWRKVRVRGVLPSEEELALARRASGWQKWRLDEEGVVKTEPGIRLDMGGIGKGFAVDRMAEVLRGRGVLSFCIDSTSDVLAGEPPPGMQGWRLQMDGDQGTKECVWLSKAAISTSGSVHQFVELGGVKYSHVLDPATGLGMKDGRQVTVLAPSAALADALATAACVMSAQELSLLLEQVQGAELLRMIRPDDVKKDRLRGDGPL